MRIKVPFEISSNCPICGRVTNLGILKNKVRKKYCSPKCNLISGYITAVYKFYKRKGKRISIYIYSHKDRSVIRKKP